MRKTKEIFEILSIPVFCGVLVFTGALVQYSVDHESLESKDLRIADLEKALEVMEEANTSLKSENEAQQIMIDNLEYDLEQAKWTSLGDFTITAYGIAGQIYIAEDTGGAIKGKKIDLFVGTEADSISYGVQTHEVFIRR